MMRPAGGTQLGVVGWIGTGCPSLLSLWPRLLQAAWATPTHMANGESLSVTQPERPLLTGQLPSLREREAAWA